MQLIIAHCPVGRYFKDNLDLPLYFSDILWLHPYTGLPVTLKGVGDENGAFLVDADPSSGCFGCPVTQTAFTDFQYAQRVTTDMGVSLVSSGIPVGLGDVARASGISPETATLVRSSL